MTEIKRQAETVKTPLPESEDGRGYTTEESERLRLTTGQHEVVARRVSDRRWSVWHYHGDSTDRIAHGLDAFKAKRIGQRAIEEAA